MSDIAPETLVDTFLIGVVGFLIATSIDHSLGIWCGNLKKVGVAGWKLFFHKLMYTALGAGTMYLFFFFSHLPH